METTPSAVVANDGLLTNQKKGDKAAPTLAASHNNQLSRGVIQSGEGYRFDTGTGELKITKNEGTTKWTGSVDRSMVKTLLIYGPSSSGEVTTISKSAFASLTNLTSITLYGGITKIDDYAFYGCPNLVSVNFDSNCTSLKTIGNFAFAECTKLTTFSILPSCTLDRIFTGAFVNCTSLSTFTFPDSLTFIGESAFQGSGLQSLDLMETNIKTIGDYAFTRCPNLESITFFWIGTLSTIGTGAFSGSGITELYLHDLNNLSKIGENAFDACSSLQKVSISNCPLLTTIDESAFANCPLLETVKLADSSLVSIGPRAFSECSRLDYFDSPESLMLINGAAFFKSGIVSIDLSNTNVSEIGTNAFSYCYNLNYIDLPDTLTVISSGAFIECIALESIYFPSSLTTIGASAFENSGIDQLDLRYNSALTEIGNNAFSRCKKLTTVIFPEAPIRSIGESVFSGSSIIEVDLSPSKLLTTIGDKAFYMCPYLTKVIFPDSITTIGNAAFYLCSSLSTIALPDNLITIGNDAFNRCSSLSTIALPGSLVTIGTNAFYLCSSLSSIALPNSLTTLGESSFSACPLLKTVTFPDSLTTLGERVFEGSGIVAADLSNTKVEYFPALLFANCTSLESVLFPTNLISIGVSTFVGSKITAADLSACTKLTTIWNSAFENCIALENVSFPDSLNVIHAHAFTNTGITKADLSKCTTLTQINEKAFSNCANLVELSLPLNAPALGTNVFDNTPNLIIFVPYDAVGYTAENQWPQEKIVFGAALADLLVNYGRLVPAFFPGTNDYTLLYLNTLDKLSFTVKAYRDETIKLNDTTLTSGETAIIDLKKITDKTIKIEVINSDQDKRTYTITLETMKTYTITATAGEGGIITPTQASVMSGDSQSFTIIANSGYILNDVTVDDISVKDQLQNNTYTFTDVNANHTIKATFTEEQKPGVTKYELTVINGTGSGSYVAGALVTLQANSVPAGHIFTEWTGGNDDAFDSRTALQVTFTMPAEDVTITANYKVIDLLKPTGKIQIGEQIWSSLLDSFAFNTFFKDEQTVTIIAEDNSNEPVIIEYYLHKETTALTLKDLKAITTWTVYKSLVITPNDKLIIYVKLTDTSNNVSYLSSDGIVFDKTAPIFQGATNNQTYTTSMTVTVSDDHLQSVMLNEQEQLPADYTLLSKEIVLSTNGTHVIKATDKAGNETAIIVIIQIPPNLTKIESLEAITDVMNGTPLKEINLPEQVTITTTDGNKQVNVIWDLDKVNDYDPNSEDKQTFTISGKVTLPDGVTNTDNVSLEVKISVTVKALPLVETPTISLVRNSQTNALEITITCATENAAIYYTLDSAEPTGNSTLYEHPIEIKQNTTIKAIAVKENMKDSIITEASYTLHTIKVTAGSGGNIDPSGEVTVESGESLTFTITANSNYRINEILVDGKSVPVSSTYTFEKVTDNHTIQVSFTYIGSSGPSTPPVDPPVKPPVEPEPEPEPVIPDENGNVEIKVDEKKAEELLEQAVNNDSNALELLKPEQITDDLTSVSLPKADLATISEKIAEHETINSVSITTSTGTIVVEQEVLADILESTEAETVSFAVNDAKDKLTEEQKQAVGNNPVFEINIHADDQKVTSFNGKTITISLPYELKEGEDPNNIVIYHLKDDGTVEKMNGYYDKESKQFIFKTNHLSMFFIAYEAAEPVTPDQPDDNKNDNIIYYAIAAIVVIILIIALAYYILQKKQ